eukprot:873317-Rhodomonas_salina.3
MHHDHHHRVIIIGPAGGVRVPRARPVYALRLAYPARVTEASLDYAGAQTEPTVLYEDNMAGIFMSRTSVMYHKARHIDTRLYHLLELCKNKMMVLETVTARVSSAEELLLVHFVTTFLL